MSAKTNLSDFLIEISNMELYGEIEPVSLVTLKNESKTLTLMDIDFQHYDLNTHLFEIDHLNIRGVLVQTSTTELVSFNAEFHRFNQKYFRSSIQLATFKPFYFYELSYLLGIF